MFQVISLNLIGEIDQNIAEKDLIEPHYMKTTNESGYTLYYNSKTDKNIRYAFHCDHQSWVCLVEKYSIQIEEQLC